MVVVELEPGSSPHTRGAPVFGSNILGAVVDHPRIRGEHCLAVIYPPWMYWIIPAYAGSTVCQSSTRIGLSDHPRIRGEHAGGQGEHRVLAGSSPHTRGAPGMGAVQKYRGGIIPAYAGSTAVTEFHEGAGRDHPRIRGEHAAELRAQVGADRIIPAYAGSTVGILSSLALSGDHPRIRGEHRAGFSARLREAGSSPHTRGAPQARLRRGFRPRIIPAYAGSTVAKIPELKL